MIYSSSSSKPCFLFSINTDQLILSRYRVLLSFSPAYPLPSPHYTKPVHPPVTPMQPNTTLSLSAQHTCLHTNQFCPYAQHLSHLPFPPPLSPLHQTNAPTSHPNATQYYPFPLQNLFSLLHQYRSTHTQQILCPSISLSPGAV